MLGRVEQAVAAEGTLRFFGVSLNRNTVVQTSQIAEIEVDSAICVCVPASAVATQELGRE